MDRCIKSRMVNLSKIEAAKRQIESAIWLWFVGEDMVSVHTLAASAHRILLEVASIWGASAWPTTEAYLPGRTEEGTRVRSDDAVTYFQDAKHEENYQISEQWTELYLFDAVMAYSNLARDHGGSALMSTYVVRFGVQRPDLFLAEAFSLLEEKVSKTFNVERLEQLSKIDFLKEFIGFLEQPIP